jgi:membrane protease YdiL (CAAX protease family)
VLTEKPWKLEAIARLLIGVFICMCAGSLVSAVVYHGSGYQKHRAFISALSILVLLLLVVALLELGKPWTRENFVRRIGIFFICFYPGLILSLWAIHLAGASSTNYSMGQMLLGLFSLQGAVLVLTWRMLRQQKITWGNAFGFSNHWAKAILFGTLVAGIFLPVGVVLQHLCDFIMRLPQSPVQPVEQQAVQTLRTVSSWAQRLLAGISTIALAPAGEEMLFRGILYPTIKQAGFPKLSLWLTSLAFAAIHLNAVTFLPLLVLSLLLTFLYEKTNNLLAPITTHAVFNAVQFVLLYVQQYESGNMN